MKKESWTAEGSQKVNMKDMAGRRYIIALRVEGVIVETPVSPPFLNTQWRTKDVPIGKRNIGSGIVRLVNQSIPPVSSPGTGKCAIALRSTNVPYPTKTCKNGIKVL